MLRSARAELHRRAAALGIDQTKLVAAAKQAGTLIFAAQNSQIWLVLRPTVGTNTKAPVISASNLVGH